jgi:hypothetical protein
MTNQEAFEVWAPPDGRWSRWVKPVLFAQGGREAYFATVTTPGSPSAEPLAEDWRSMDVSWAPDAGQPIVIVVDLPGGDSVRMGLALAGRGYRPVPLFNSCDGPYPVVDVQPIRHWLRVGTPVLQQMNLPATAPPAFLLDAYRRTGRGEPDEGDFDNRSISFPTDFPSANFLLGHGFRQALLVQQHLLQPQADLAHTLRRWQEAGIQILSRQLSQPGPASSIRVERPTLFGWAWYRCLELLGMRRGTLGGYGGILPEASSG